VLYPVLKRQSQSISLGYVASRTLESTVIVIGIVSVLSVVTLRQDVGGAGAADGASLVLAGRSLVAIHDWTFLLGPAFCAGFGTGLLLGYLMYKSGLVPRRMAMLGLIGGPLIFASATAILFGAYKNGGSRHNCGQDETKIGPLSRVFVPVRGVVEVVLGVDNAARGGCLH
jgi:hypothetical protein